MTILIISPDMSALAEQVRIDGRIYTAPAMPAVEQWWVTKAEAAAVDQAVEAMEKIFGRLTRIK